MSDKLRDTSRWCMHTMTTRPLTLEQALPIYAEAGVRGVSVWREHAEPYGAKRAGEMVRAAGMKVVSLVRGGFFVDSSALARDKAKTENRKIIDEAAEMGAPLVVLVCGAHPEVELQIARQQVVDGIASVLDHAKQCNVKLAIEPLHPMYADTRSCINTMDSANDIVWLVNNEYLGIAVDVYHVWWDKWLRSELQRAKGKIFAFHVCDWRSPTRDLLNDREVMGRGCINIREIRGWAEQNGFNGPIEVEIFSDEYWAKDQANFVRLIKNCYLETV